MAMAIITITKNNFKIRQIIPLTNKKNSMLNLKAVKVFSKFKTNQFLNNTKKGQQDKINFLIPNNPGQQIQPHLLLPKFLNNKQLMNLP